jgi:lambda family phage portal protein
MAAKIPAFDRALLRIAPGWARSRIRARVHGEFLARHYEAASPGRRNANWTRSHSDANTAAGMALPTLRALSRDLRRNNPWARRGVQVVANNTVGWGIVPKPSGGPNPKLAEAWKEWAETTQCDADGRLTFYGIERQVMETIAESGEVLIRARWRYATDGLALPLQLHVLEPDYIDTTRDNFTGPSGGSVIQGVEFDRLGERTGYYLFPSHPGSNFATGTSKWYPASDFLHVFRAERPGQVRGVPWLAAVIARLRDFDDYEDATISRHSIAALYAAFVTDPNGEPGAIGEQSTDAATGHPVETLEPGMIKYLAPGQAVEFGSPPVPADGGFTDRSLRAVAAGLGVTFEDLTGNYGNVNYSSGRLGWMAHWANVEDWRWNMLVPQFCAPAWGWAMKAAALAGLIGAGEAPRADWTPPARPMLDPDKEGLAAMRRVRAGVATLPEVVREQGKDFDAHVAEIAASNKKLDALGIVLDSDPRMVTQSGQAQVAPAADAGKPPPPKSDGDGKDPEDMPDETNDAEK